MLEDSIRKLRRQLRELHNYFVCPYCNYKWTMRKPHNSGAIYAVHKDCGFVLKGKVIKGENHNKQ